MPDITEMDSYAMLCQDWGSAYRITRTPGAARPYQAERRDDRAVVLSAADPGALRNLIRADYLARPVPPRGNAVTTPSQSARSQPPVATEPGAVEPPKHPMHALTTYELRDYRRQLESAIAFFDRQDPVPPPRRRLQVRLAAVLAEQDDRKKLADA